MVKSDVAALLKVVIKGIKGSHRFTCPHVPVEYPECFVGTSSLRRFTKAEQVLVFAPRNSDEVCVIISSDRYDENDSPQNAFFAKFYRKKLMAKVAQTSESALRQVSQPAETLRSDADLEIGDTVPVCGRSLRHGTFATGSG